MLEGTVFPHVTNAIEQLYAANWQRIDGRIPDSVGALFLDDGVLRYGAHTWTGREAIDGFYNPYRASNRARSRVTRHLSLNLRIGKLSYGRFSVAGTVFVFSGIGDAMPLPSAAPSGVGDFFDECLVDDGGRAAFVSRETRMIFATPETFDFDATGS